MNNTNKAKIIKSIGNQLINYSYYVTLAFHYKNKDGNYNNLYLIKHNLWYKVRNRNDIKVNIVTPAKILTIYNQVNQDDHLYKTIMISCLIPKINLAIIKSKLYRLMQILINNKRIWHIKYINTDLGQCVLVNMFITNNEQPQVVRLGYDIITSLMINFKHMLSNSLLKPNNTIAIAIDTLGLLQFNYHIQDIISKCNGKSENINLIKQIVASKYNQNELANQSSIIALDLNQYSKI